MLGFNDLSNYAKGLIAYNKAFHLTPEECVSEGEKLNPEQPQKGIVSFILTEKRKAIAALQEAGKWPKTATSKVCNECNQEKSANHFLKRVCEKTGMHFLNGKCNNCRNERRRQRYKNDARAKEKARLRYLKFKQKQVTGGKRLT